MALSLSVSDERVDTHVEALHFVTNTVHFHRFAECPVNEGKTARFSCLGYQWQLELTAVLGTIRTVRLVLCSWIPKVKVYYHFPGIGPVKAHIFNGWGNNPGWKFDQSKALKRYLKDGTLSIQIRLATEKCLPQPLPQTFIQPHTFIPSNPSACKTIQDSFMDEDSADVVIEVAENEGLGASSTKFYAHYCILKRVSPLLAELCKSSNDSQARVHITNESPDVFKDMLRFIYGLPIPAFGIDSKRTKTIIETANKYEVTNLKIEAEVRYLSSLSFSLENVVAEHLLFADSVNCALLKEKALDFIVNNLGKIVEMKALPDVTASILYDLLSAIALKDKTGGGFDTMNVNELRRLSYEKGLDIGGTREMLIAGLKKK